MPAPRFRRGQRVAIVRRSTPPAAPPGRYRVVRICAVGQDDRVCYLVRRGHDRLSHLVPESWLVGLVQDSGPVLSSEPAPEPRLGLALRPAGV